MSNVSARGVVGLGWAGLGIYSCVAEDWKEERGDGKDGSGRRGGGGLTTGLDGPSVWKRVHDEREAGP